MSNTTFNKIVTDILIEEWAVPGAIEFIATGIGIIAVIKIVIWVKNKIEQT